MSPLRLTADIFAQMPWHLLRKHDAKKESNPVGLLFFLLVLVGFALFHDLQQPLAEEMLPRNSIIQKNTKKGCFMLVNML